MMTFVQRRIRNSIAVVVVGLFLYALAMHYVTPQYNIQIWSGWLLMTLLFLLFFYSIRKKIILLPIGKSSSWLQLHSYAGFLSLFVFLQHISFQLPNGIFEMTLAILFVGTAVSGIIGLVFSRIIPRYPTRRGEEVIYERIPQFIYELRSQALVLVVDCTSKTHSAAIADYYQNHLAWFFLKPEKTFFHLFGSMDYLHAMQSRHNNFCRYLNEQECVYAEQLFELVRKKYDLDFHYALQGLLKAWLFVHIPLTYSLIIAAIVHLLLIYAFVGNL